MTKDRQESEAQRTSRRAALRAITATASIGTLLGSASTGAAARSSGDGDAGGATRPTEAEGIDGDRADARRPTTPTLGANLNGQPRRLNDSLDLLDASNTTWVRAFIDVRDKLNDETPPSEDPDVLALRRAALERNCKLVVNLKWDFKVNWTWDDKEPIRVPEPGSSHEQDLLRCATRYLQSIGAPVDVVVLGNEPMWETQHEDASGENPPIVQFTRRLKAHLVQHGDHGDPSYLLGAFNRLYDDRVREKRFPTFCRELFRMAREDDDVAGVDLHVHYDGHDEARKMVRVAREQVPDGVLAVTEFSPVFRYDRHVRTAIGEWEAGRTFAGEYGYSPDMTAVDYFERAKDDPCPCSEMADFYEAMPWYDVNLLERNYRLFERFGVDVATFGFLQGVGMRDADWRRPGWTPFHINFLYQNALMRGRGAHQQYLDDYREMA